MSFLICIAEILNIIDITPSNEEKQSDLLKGKGFGILEHQKLSTFLLQIMDCIKVFES